MIEISEELPPLSCDSDLRRRQELLRKKISEKRSKLASLPAGKLSVTASHGSVQYRISRDQTGRLYLSKKQQELIKQLAVRRYLEAVLPALEKELKLIDALLFNHEKVLGFVENRQAKSLWKLMDPVTLTDEEYARRWQEISYTKKKVASTSEYYTLKGEQVRSKSEIIIADMLAQANIPYHYEYPTTLYGGVVLCPDFLCLNRRTRKEYIWEHLGMMDDPDYVAEAVRRFQLYEKSGYYLGESLLVTVETGSQQLDTRLVKQRINRFLL